MIKEVSCNQGQTKDIYQWEYSIIPLTKKTNMVAWYKGDDLILENNLSDLISAAINLLRRK